jgi:hypothetical protein
MDALGQHAAGHWLRSYPPGVPVTRDVLAQSVSHVFDEATNRALHRPVVINYWPEITRRELRDENAC